MLIDALTQEESLKQARVVGLVSVMYGASSCHDYMCFNSPHVGNEGGSKPSLVQGSPIKVFEPRMVLDIICATLHEIMVFIRESASPSLLSSARFVK